MGTQGLRYSNLQSGSLHSWLCITTNILWRNCMYNKVLRYNLLIRLRVQLYLHSGIKLINCNFGLVKSWQKSPRPIRARVLFVPFWSHSKPHTRSQLEWPKRLAQLDNQLYIRRETYRILQDGFSLRSYKEWNALYVSVGHSLILSLEIDWETTLLGH